MRLALLGLAAAGAVAVALTLALRDPDAPFAVAMVGAGVAVSVGSLAARLLLGRPRLAGRRARSPARALRRGAAIGVGAGILVALRAIDGLTPITAGFVVVGLALAEVMLTARTS